MARSAFISVAVVSHSVTGTTDALAQSIAQGVNSVEGAQAINMRIENDQLATGRFPNDEQMQQITACDAIVFGTPTFMGGPTAQFKAFADASSEQWEDQLWANKIAAGFTIGSNYSGDQYATIQYLSTLAGQHGMIWVGVDSPGGDAGIPNRLGAQGGVIAHSPDGKIHKQDAQLAHYLGSRVASLAGQFKRGGMA